MKRDIKINYSVLEHLRDKINNYKIAMETIQEVLKTVNTKLEEENQGEAIDALKGKYTELQGDLDGCIEEVNDLYTIFNGYIYDMQDIIKPIKPELVMQVDRNDIYWNMQSIFGACDGVGLVRMNTGTYMSLPNLFKTDEEKENEEENKRKIEEVWDEIKKCWDRLNIHKDDLQYIYDNKIIPYEDKDDEYKTKASNLHSKYTGKWELVVELSNDFNTITDNIGKGIVDSLVDLVKGIFGLAEGIILYVGSAIGAGIGVALIQVTGDAPDCLQYCIEKSDEYDEAIGTVLNDPTLIIEGLSQGISDSVEEKGISYCSGYAIGEVAQLVVGTKGLDKLKTISKVEKGNYSLLGNMVEGEGAKYQSFLRNGNPGSALTVEEIYGINKVESSLKFSSVDANELIGLRNAEKLKMESFLNPIKDKTFKWAAKPIREQMLESPSANLWGTLEDGTNQGVKHFADYWEKYPERIPSLAKRLGADASKFENTVDGFNNFTEQVLKVKNNGILREVNGKQIYYLEGAAKPKKGVVVIFKDGKIQSMMPSDIKSFNKLQ